MSKTLDTNGRLATLRVDSSGRLMVVLAGGAIPGIELPLAKTSLRVDSSNRLIVATSEPQPQGYYIWQRTTTIWTDTGLIWS